MSMKILSQMTKSIIREMIETILLISLIICCFHISVQNFQVEGSSMHPNIQEGNCVVAEKISYWKTPYFSNPENYNYIFDKPNRGEIIIFKFPNDPKRYFVKRIIGLEGDHIEIKYGDVYVNQLKLQEPYLINKNPESEYLAPAIVGKGQYYVLGDNRTFSNDSRNWGTISDEHVIGKYFFKYGSSICNSFLTTSKGLR